ncbi:hypothetical protein HY380_01090 [Candidatus Saccharibacteria bacterium]|nr:hypothetical protein [Candidatus Saccharibacteria bacterium]
MLFVRRFFLILTLVLLFVFLLNLAADYAIVRIAGQPTAVKKIINDSGLYDNVVDGVLAQAKTISAGKDEVQTQTAIFQRAAKQAFSGDYLRQVTEPVIDGLYTWLDGQTKLPDFKINITDAKKRLVDSLASQLKQRLAKLPVCSSAIDAANYDAFKANCRPVTLDPASVTNRLKRQLLDSPDFLPDSVLTASDIKASNKKASIFKDQLKDIPKIYQNVKKSPPAFMLFSLFLSMVAVLLSGNRLVGLRHVGITVLITGFVILSLAILIQNRLLPDGLEEIRLDNPALTKNARAVVETIASAINGGYKTVGIIYLVGGGLLTGSLIYHQGRHKPTAESPASKPTKT